MGGELCRRLDRRGRPLARRAARRGERHAAHRRARPGGRRRLRPARAVPAVRHRRGPAAPARPGDIGELADRHLVPDLGRRAEARPRRAHGQGGAGPRGRRPRHRHRRCSGPAPGRRPSAHRRAGRQGRRSSGASGPSAGWPRWPARVRDRHAQAGEVAFLLEPDLKEGRGGLRDVHALRWAQAAADDPVGHRRRQPRRRLRRAAGGAGRAAPAHRSARRPAAAPGAGRRRRRPRLRRRRRADARASPTPPARSPGPATTPGHRIESSLAGPLGRACGASGRWAVAWSCATARSMSPTSADVAGDPALALRAAAAAARHGTQLDRATLDRLARRGRRRRPTRGPTGTRAALVGPAAWPGRPPSVLLEALDQQGVWERYSPSGRRCGASPSATPTTASPSTGTCGRRRPQAARSPAACHRPDLLVLAGLLHDIGKGEPGRPHRQRRAPGRPTSPGAWASTTTTPRCWSLLCRHHLLLPDVATRRDIDDPATIDAVVGDAGRRPRGARAARRPHRGRLAGHRAGGLERRGRPDLVRALVARVDHVLGGGEAGERRRRVPRRPTSGRCCAAGEQAIVTDGDRLTVVAADRPGLFAGWPACCRCTAWTCSTPRRPPSGGWALEVFRVESSFGPTFAWDEGGRRPGAGAGRAPGDPGPAGRPGPHVRRPAGPQPRPRARSSPRSAST